MAFDFLLELALLREMSRQDAESMLKSVGATDLSKDGLLAFRKRYMLQNHPDKKPAAERQAANDKLGMINAAIDMVAGIDDDRRKRREAEKYGSEYAAHTRARNPEREPDTGVGDADQTVPKWAWAGYSGGAAPSFNIYRQDYTDMNYFKKQMWLLSKMNPKQQEYTIMAFDGHFFRNSVTVYGSPKIFENMAEAMQIWNSQGGNPYNTRAVFCYAKSDPRDLLLIYADGKYYDPPKHFEHESFNLNPSNDQSFVRGLPRMLDGLRDGADAYA